MVPFPPSKRGETDENFVSGLVDTLGLAVPVVDVDMTPTEESPVVRSARLKVNGEEDIRFRRVLPGGGFLATGIGGKAWFEASLPKRVGSWEALPTAAALEVAREMYREVERFATFAPGETFEKAGVVRLDSVQEIEGVLDQEQLLTGLSLVKRDSRHSVKRHLDPERGDAQTLKVGPKSWEAYLYDKHAETAGLAPKGMLRFETRGRSDLLSSVWAEENVGLMRVVREVDGGKVRRLSREMFRRVRFDQEVSAMGEVAVSIMRAEGLSDRERLACLGYATAVGLGMPVPAGKDAARKYRRVLEALGITPGRSPVDAGTYRVRLDYDEGKAIYRAAA